ncbi:MAG: DUF4384 domain-containing protein [Candidatus Sumerlaeota bacterium]|nr:DUF4384 domain-containing protein [Candidatus Sumerlaeota bacterium]
MTGKRLFLTSCLAIGLLALALSLPSVAQAAQKSSGKPLPGAAPAATPTPTATPTPWPGLTGPGGCLHAATTILITDPNFQQVFPTAAPGLDLRLAIAVDILKDPPPGAQEVFIFSFFDEYGAWIADRDAGQVIKPQKGSFIYNVKYQAPAGKPGEFALFFQAWIDSAGKTIDTLQMVTIVLVSGAPQNRAALDKARGKVDSRAKGVEANAAALGATFRTREGAKGLTVKIQPRESGDHVAFDLSANRDCQAVLLDLSSGGELKMLAPAKGQKPLSLKAGEKTAFPAGGEGLRISGPAGVETVAVLALEDGAPGSEGPMETAAKWAKAGCASDAAALAVAGEAAVIGRQAGTIGKPGAAAAVPAKAGKAPEKGKESLGNLFEKK